MITVSSIIFLPVEVEAAQTVTSGEVWQLNTKARFSEWKIWSSRSISIPEWEARISEFPTNTNAALFTDTLLTLELHDV